MRARLDGSELTAIATGDLVNPGMYMYTQIYNNVQYEHASNYMSYLIMTIYTVNLYPLHVLPMTVYKKQQQNIHYHHASNYIYYHYKDKYYVHVHLTVF